MQIGRRGIPFAIEPGLEPSSGVAGPLSNSTQRSWCRAGGASVQNGRSYTNGTPSPLLCSSDPGAGPKNSVGVSFATFPGEGPKSPGGISRPRGIFTFWLGLSPWTPRGPLNFFLVAKFHPRCGVEAVEGREETWRETEKECGVCRGSQASGPRDRGIRTPVHPPKAQAPMQPRRNPCISIPNDPTREILAPRP